MNAFEDYAFRVELGSSHGEALARTKEALRAEGFGVLTETRRAGHPEGEARRGRRELHHPRGLQPATRPPGSQVEPEVGLLLPCNVIVYERDGQAGTVVSPVDPISMLGAVSEPQLQAVAEEAHARLGRVADALRG